MKQITIRNLILCFAMLAVGCGRGTSQSTPKEAFNGFKDAVSTHDWQTAFKYLAEDSQITLLAQVLMEGTITVILSQDKEKERILEELKNKHGINMSTVMKKGSLDSLDRFKNIFAGVKDKGVCFQELTKFVEDMSEEKSEVSEMIAGKLKNAVFKDAKIEGDTATATLTVDGKDDKINPMIFKKIKGKWFIDLMALKE